MTPYYQDHAVTIYHGDCRDVLPQLSLRADAIITDPPFFMPATHYQSRTTWQRSWGDTSPLAEFFGRIIELCTRHLKPSGHFLTFCDGNSFPVFYPEVYRRFTSVSTLVWDKDKIGMGRVWRKQHELLIAARWDTSEFHDDGVTRSDVIRCKPTPSAARLHPVEKPLAVIGHVLAPTVPPGGLVVDPFMGAGSTLQAARSLGRRAVGIETEEHYCELAAQRFAQDALDFGGAA
jgi:DNA modification methylase